MMHQARGFSFHSHENGEEEGTEQKSATVRSPSSIPTNTLYYLVKVHLH